MKPSGFISLNDNYDKVEQWLPPRYFYTQTTWLTYLRCLTPVGICFSLRPCETSHLHIKWNRSPLTLTFKNPSQHSLFWLTREIRLHSEFIYFSPSQLHHWEVSDFKCLIGWDGCFFMRAVLSVGFLLDKWFLAFLKLFPILGFSKVPK